jgi:putative tryptophan/tyrosine transport system substrate-binding protein
MRRREFIRWAEGRSDRSAEIAAEFVRSKVDVIVTYSTEHAQIAKQTTASIPIVAPLMGDPLGTGLVTSLARPGGNLTGLSSQTADLAGKRFELLRELVPGLRRLAILFNVNNTSATSARWLCRSAWTCSRQKFVPPRTLPPLSQRSRRRTQMRFFVVGDPLTQANRARIHTLALAARLPTIYTVREFVEAGGLMSYGPNHPSLFRRAAEYVGKILRGTKPSDLPVEQPTKYDLVINLATAKALHLIPESILLCADEVIE